MNSANPLTSVLYTIYMYSSDQSTNYKSSDRPCQYCQRTCTAPQPCLLQLLDACKIAECSQQDSSSALKYSTMSEIVVYRYSITKVESEILGGNTPQETENGISRSALQAEVMMNTMNCVDQGAAHPSRLLFLGGSSRC